MGKRKHGKKATDGPTTDVVVQIPTAIQGAKVAPAPKEGPSASDSEPERKNHKDKIPKAVREQLWVRDIGEKFYGKCKTSWCTNRVSVFDFQCGHDVPESKGGPTTLENMVVLCSRCNNSMSNNYTFSEWQIKYQPKTLGWRRYFCGL
jgi:5-methylcytosine-specific restriction endonuclease McrA